MWKEFTVIVRQLVSVFSKAESSWHAANYPAAQQNSARLSLRQFSVLLVNRFSDEHVLVFGVNSFTFVCSVYKGVHCVKVLTEKYAMTFTSELRLAYPLRDGQVVVIFEEVINFIRLPIALQLNSWVNKVGRE